MSFNLNDKFSIDAATASSRLEGNLQVKNSLTFRDEENVMSFNSFTVPYNVGLVNTVVSTGSNVSIGVTTQGSNLLLYQLFNGGVMNSNVSIWNGVSNISVTVGRGSNVSYLFRVGVSGVGNSNLTYLGSNVIEATVPVKRLLNSNVFITDNYFRSGNSYYNITGATFTDLESVGSNYVLGGYYQANNPPFSGVHLNVSSGSNGPWTVLSSNVLPLTNFQFNTFVVGVRAGGSGEIVWGKALRGIANSTVATVDTRVLRGIGERVYVCSYISSDNQPIGVVRREAGGGSGTFVQESQVPGTGLNSGRLLVLLLVEGLGGGLERQGYILINGSDFSFGNFFEWSSGGGSGDGVLYVRNNNSAGYRVYNSDNSYVTMLGIKNVLMRFSNALRLRWYAPVVSLNSGLGRATQRFGGSNEDYTCVQTVNAAGGDVLVYNADKSVYNTILGLTGYNVVGANIIYDELGNVHNMSFNRFTGTGTPVLSLGEGPGRNFLGVVSLGSGAGITQQFTDGYLDERNYSLSAGATVVGNYYVSSSNVFKVLRVGDAIDKVIIDGSSVQVTGNLDLRGGIICPKFQVLAIAEGLAAVSVVGGASWTVTGNWRFYGGTVLINMAVSGFTAAAGNATWTLQYSSNSGVSYVTVGTLVQYFNGTSDHEHQSGTIRWLPGSISVTNFRVNFTRSTDTSDYLYLHMTEFPF